MIDLENSVHPRECHGQGAFDAGRAARQARSRAPRDQRHEVGGGQPNELGDLDRGGRQRHRERQARLEVGSLVGSVRLPVDFVAQDADVRKVGGDRVEERPLPSFVAHRGRDRV